MLVENLTDFEANMVLSWFLHHVSMDDRIKLMRTMPLIYNKLVGREVLKVMFKGDDNDV